DRGDLLAASAVSGVGIDFPHFGTGSAPVPASAQCARLESTMNVCSICDGVGLVRVLDSSGRWVSRACECQATQREERRIAAARVPARYRDCTLDAFHIYTDADKSLADALTTARRFVDEYPVNTAGKGLLFVGTAGLGKTHLAVGVLQRLVRERGAKGLFCDYRDLLKNIQNSYNS